MFAIEMFVGRGFGRWFRLSARFDSREEAQERLNADQRREWAGDVTPLFRRVVPV